MNHIRNFSTGKAGLTGISGGATTYSTGSAGFSFALDGKAYTKTQVSGGATPTTDGRTGAAINLTANYGTVVVWAVNSAGTVSVYQGGEEALDSAGNFKVAPAFPALPDSVAPFAYTIHKAASNTSGTWTFGSSNWNTTGLTHTVVDVMQLPSRPQVS
jgi:hypothetical protein